MKPIAKPSSIAVFITNGFIISPQQYQWALILFLLCIIWADYLYSVMIFSGTQKGMPRSAPQTTCSHLYQHKADGNRLRIRMAFATCSLHCRRPLPFSQMQCNGDSSLRPLKAAALLCPVPLPMGLSIKFSARRIYWNSEGTKDSLNALSDVKYILHSPAKEISVLRSEEVTAKYFRGIMFIDWDWFPCPCWSYSHRESV